MTLELRNRVICVGALRYLKAAVFEIKRGGQPYAGRVPYNENLGRHDTHLVARQRLSGLPSQRNLLTPIVRLS